MLPTWPVAGATSEISNVQCLQGIVINDFPTLIDPRTSHRSKQRSQVGRPVSKWQYVATAGHHEQGRAMLLQSLQSNSKCWEQPLFVVCMKIFL